jgi:hypothetical protein
VQDTTQTMLLLQVQERARVPGSCLQQLQAAPSDVDIRPLLLLLLLRRRLGAVGAAGSSSCCCSGGSCGRCLWGLLQLRQQRVCSVCCVHDGVVCGDACAHLCPNLHAA